MASPDLHPHVELRCRAYPELWVDGVRVPLKLRHGLALLVFLAEVPKKISRSQLAELLWPDAPVDTGRARLRRLCHEVNGTLGYELLGGDGETLQLQRSTCRFESDVERVRRAARELLAAGAGEPAAAALALASEPGAHHLLLGFELDAEPFVDWLRARRADHERELARALGQAAQQLLALGRAAPAALAAEALVRLDALSDVGHALRIAARGQLGDAAGVEAAYFACAELLRAELGARPSAQIEAAYQRAVRQLQQASEHAVQAGSLLAPLRFADTEDGSVAFLELGRPDARCGTLVILFGLWSHAELSWEEPRIRAMLERLAQRFHVVLMDRRGTGLSERLQAPYTVEAGADDVDAVLAAVGARRAWLFGNSMGGPIMIEYAATRRERVRGLVLYGAGACSAAAEDYPWAPTRAQLAEWLERLHAGWGRATSLAEFAPSAAHDASARGWWARTLRQSASRNSMRTLIRAFSDTDVRHRLGELAVPTLVVQREGDRIVRAGAARYIAERVPGAQLVMLPGEDHLAWHGDTPAVLGALECFVEARGEFAAA